MAVRLLHPAHNDYDGISLGKSLAVISEGALRNGL